MTEPTSEFSQSETHGLTEYTPHISVRAAGRLWRLTRAADLEQLWDAMTFGCAVKNNQRGDYSTQAEQRFRRSYEAAFDNNEQQGSQQLLRKARSAIGTPYVPGGMSVASLAQLVEQLIRNQQVKSSSLLAGSTEIKPLRCETARAFFVGLPPGYHRK